jgi:predicted nucleic acid-binding protein
MYLLDSNIYIDSFNNAAFGAEFRAFHQAALPRLVLSAVVAHELLVGANDSGRWRALQKAILEPFRTRRRVHTPSLSTWELAVEIDRGLRALGGYAGSLAQRHFANDIMIAATAREIGATIVTRNLGDFGIIAQVVPIQVEPPWPTLA